MLNEKLSRREEEVMNAVYTLAGGRERVLVSADEILALLPPKGRYDETGLLRILRGLEMDGYFQLIPSDRKGERMYVVHMLDAGLAFRRTDSQRKRALAVRVGITVALAVLSALIGVILKAIIS